MRKPTVFVVDADHLQSEEKTNMEVGLEEALDLAGVGKYQLFHCALMLATLCASILEMIGIAFILPAAACDLGLPEGLKGIITSVPNIGVILTAPFWGRAADSRGRKPVLLVTCGVSGLLCLAAALMPNLLSYVLCKFLGSLFLACPSSLGFAYAGELVPRARRDLAVMLCNGFLMLTTTLSPLLAWGILSEDWRYPLGALILRPWRLLTAIYALPLILAALWMMRADESPKFLMTKGHHDQALEVLRRIHAVNTGLDKEDYCVTSLKESPQESGVTVGDGSAQDLTPKARGESALALLQPPHLKWLALTGTLMFGLFSLLNGLFLFAPDTINKVMRGSSAEEGTVCVVMNQVGNQPTTSCVDSISRDTFAVMAATTLVYGAVVLVASMCPLAKRTLLAGMFAVTGAACLLSGLLTNRMAAGAAMSALQLTALGIGPLTAYAVHLFPTSLRATAVGAVMMFGRVGSVVGANAAGVFLSLACTATFYGFAALLFVCAALSFLLPPNQVKSGTTNNGHSINENSDSR